jgi:hypothetical protein
MDKGSVELIGPYGLERDLTILSTSINNLSTGVVTSYALYILLGLICYLCVLYYSNFVENFPEILLLILFCSIISTKKDPYETINKVLKNTLLKKLFCKKTFLALVLCNIVGITIRTICIKMGFNLAINDPFLYIISINLTSVIRSYISIVIESIYIKSKLSNKMFIVIKLIICFFIGLIITSCFIYIDNNSDCLFYFIFLIRPSINIDSYSISMLGPGPKDPSTQAVGPLNPYARAAPQPPYRGGQVAKISLLSLY